MIDIENLKIGDKLVCIINSKASLKIGKEYTVKSIHNDIVGLDICIINDSGVFQYYSISRFVSKSKFREYIIDNLDSNISILNFCKQVSKIIEMRKDDVITYHESLERLSELAENIDNLEIDDSILKDNNLFRLDEEKILYG
jgi:hypothetical protein